MLKRILICAVFILWAVNALAATWYIAPSTVTTTGTGTREQPFKANAINWTPIAAGDTIYLRTTLGNYNELLTVNKSGSAGNYITIDSDPLDGGKAIFDGQSTRIACINPNSKTYIILKNVIGKNTTGANNSAFQMYSNWKFFNIEVDNCYYAISSLAGSANPYIDGLTVTNSDYSISINNGSGAFVIKNVNAITPSNKRGILTIFGSSTSGTLDMENISLDGGSVNGSTSQGLLYISSGAFTSGTIKKAVVKNSATVGGYITASTNITLSDCRFEKNYRGGCSVNTPSTNIVFNDCKFIDNPGDGHGVNGYNTVTLNRCSVIGNGKPTPFDPVNDGDGFTCHGTAVVNYNYCVSLNNRLSGFAPVDTTSGSIHHCVAAFNGTSSVPTNRAGMFINVSGVNASDSNKSWVVKNTISYKNYPREVWLTTAGKSIVASDYNSYKELDTAKFATIDGGSTNISWATYHATYEANSKNEDSKVAPSGIIPYNSPCVDAAPWMVGINDGGQTDPWGKKVYGLPNIGADQGAGMPTGGIKSSGFSKHFR